MKLKEIYSILARYILLLIIYAFPYLFYKIFGLVTIFPVQAILWLAYGAEFYGEIISYKGIYLEIAGACIAGSAYYLLLILNLTTPMCIRKRAKNLLFVWGAFLLFNILRIVVFSALVFAGFKYFDFTHKLFWYIGSTIVVVFIWFAGVKVFNIKEIPAFSDMKSIFLSVRKSGKKN